MTYVLETTRLFLRELTLSDKVELAKVLSDVESMRYYPHAFSETEVENWISWNIENYKSHNHGLWAVVLKENGAFVGDCGITLQEIDGKTIPEIGYHIVPKYAKKGYATEAANACKEYAFGTLGMKTICSYMSVDNIPSQKVAEKMGMVFQKKFKKTIQNIEIEEMLYCARAE